MKRIMEQSVKLVLNKNTISRCAFIKMYIVWFRCLADEKTLLRAGVLLSIFH